MEIVPKIESQKPRVKPTALKKDYAKANQSVNDLKQAEERERINEFLGHLGIANSPELRDYLTKLILDRSLLDPSFSLYDLTPEEVKEIQKESRSRKVEQGSLNNINEANKAEVFIDNLKQKGFSNYETLQKLLQAHEAGEVTLLDEKYANFSAFFQELSTGEYGAKDTKRIIQTINDSGVDLTTPNAFEEVIWTIYENDNISTATKEKICIKFKLKPISTGDDLLDNLRTKKAQINQHAQQLSDTDLAIEALDTEITTLETDLSALKKAILLETDMEKRLKLEKEYDRLETLFNEQTKELEIQKKQKDKLTKSVPSQNVLVRGLKAELRERRIHIQLPKSKRSMSVPSNLGNEAIASTVNAYLVNDILTPLGLEEYFFYQSDFTGDFPHPASIERNDLLLYRLGLAREGQVLSKANLEGLSKALTEVMKPEEYRVDKTLHENANSVLTKKTLLKDGELSEELFAKELQRLL